MMKFDLFQMGICHFYLNTQPPYFHVDTLQFDGFYHENQPQTMFAGILICAIYNMSLAFCLRIC